MRHAMPARSAVSTTAILAIVALLAAVVTIPALAPRANAATITVLNADFETGSVDGSGNFTGIELTRSGGPALSIVDFDDSKVLQVANRANDYDGVETKANALVEGTTYTASVKVRLAAGETTPRSMKIVHKPGYSTVGSEVPVTADAWTTLSGTFVAGASAGLYIGTGGADVTYTYLVDDFVITYQGGCDEEPEPCVPEVAEIASFDFESGLQGWQGRGAGQVAVSDDARTGDGALSVTGRTANWHGAELPAASLLTAGTYPITAWVKLPAGVATTDTIKSTVISIDDESEQVFTTVGTATGVGADEWVEVSGSYTVTPNAVSVLYFEAATATGSFLVDDIVITGTIPCDDGSGPPPGTVMLSADFEDGTLQGWVARNGGDGDHVVGATATEAHGGTYSALVSERTSQGSGLGFDVVGTLEPGQTYELTAWVKFASPSGDDRIVFTGQTGSNTFATLGTFTGINDTSWTQITRSFTLSPGDRAFVYFETPWQDGATGNITPFLVDDIVVKVPAPVTIEDLTPIKSTLPFPMGVAIDQRETVGASSQLLLKHFNQITPENFMKPEAWYNGAGEWAPNGAQIDPLMTFAKANNLGLYGHVLVWHSQTPAWFFQDDEGAPLTTSEEDKQILRDRLEDHIFNVAKYLHDGWGKFGGENPVNAFDVVNEVVADGGGTPGGLRQSEWFRILGEEYIDLSFEYADLYFNQGAFAEPGAERPVKLFINDYNTEQDGKRFRYLNLVERLLGRDAPVDGIGHQFHVNLSMPVAALEAAIVDAKRFNLLQAVTEFDVTTGTPESPAKFIDQGYYYRDAFDIFRTYADDMYAVTVWGLIDSRSWRNSSGGPLVFDSGLQAKPAYYGIVESAGTEDPLPPPLRTADSFAGTVALNGSATSSSEWERLPLLPAGSHAKFQTRWAADHLTVYVDVDDATVDATDAVTVEVGANTYTINRSGAGTATGVTTARAGGYSAVIRVPLTNAAQGNNLQVDVRVTDNATTSGWNSTGVLGTLTLVEPLSYTEIGEASVAPVIDGTKDAVWATSRSVQTLKEVSGSGGAIGTFHTLWKGDRLYVYAEIADPSVSTTGSDPWTQDSVEIYVNPDNTKNGSYLYDDTQIRISADGAVSFGTGDETFQANRVVSEAVRVAGGYVVEASIGMLEYAELGSVHGVDFQVNDATGSARTAIRNWADPTGAGYQSNARWGVAKLVEANLAVQAPFTPKVAGAAKVGTTLKVTGLPTGTTLSYQWLRNNAAISGATKATYKLVAADAGKKISVRVTSVLAGSETLTATSAQTAAVVNVFTKTPAPKVTGTAKVGKTLKATAGTWAPKATLKYQWFSNGKAIKGATKASYKVTRAVAGTKVVVRVTGSKSGYQTVTKSSAAKSVPLLKQTVKGAKISGPTRVGGTLKATAGKSTVTTTKTYQWYQNGKVIKGATKSTYKLPKASQGKRISVKITHKAKGYANKSVTVGPTYRIAAAR